MNGARSACRPSTLRVRPVNFALSRSQHRQHTIDGIVRWPGCGPALCRWAQRQGWSGEESSRNRATRSVDAGEGRTSAHRTRNTNSATSHVTESGARSPGCWHAHAAACTNAQRRRGVQTLAIEEGAKIEQKEEGQNLAHKQKASQFRCGGDPPMSTPALVGWEPSTSAPVGGSPLTRTLHEDS